MPEIIFEGAGPFWLRTAQSAAAEPDNGSVTVTLRVLRTEGDGLVPIRVQMTPQIAKQLAEDLAAAAVTAELIQSGS